MEIRNKQEILLEFQNTLPAYVAQSPEPLINRTVFRWTPSVAYFRKELGLRCKGNVTIMNIDVVLQACSCGWNPHGKVSLDPVEIDVACIKIMDDLCPEELLCTYGEWYVERFAAGLETWNSLFEESFSDGLLASAALANENLIWKGDITSSDPNLARYDGLIKQLTAAGSPTAAPTGSMLSQLIQINASIPVDAFNFGTPIIFVGIDSLRSVQSEIPWLNWFNPINGTNLDLTNAAPGFIIPQTKTRVVGVPGLNGTGLAIGTFEKNFIFGTDFANDSEIYKLWYSDDNQEWRYKMEWFAGVAAIFPEYAVVATLEPVDLTQIGVNGVTILNTTANPVPTQTVP